MFFWSGWEPVLRVVVVTTLGFLWLVQWLFATSRARGMRVTRLFDSEPALLDHRGEVMDAAMRRHRLSEAIPS